MMNVEVDLACTTPMLSNSKAMKTNASLSMALDGTEYTDMTVL
jgi:hypothetical protein